MNEVKIALVTITRLGNKYLREFVEYYLNIGVDKIYFYDNNRWREENVMDVVSDYVNNGLVEVIYFGNAEGRIQEIAYQDFYNNHGNEYDWICYFDDDEYVVINSNENLKKFLSNPMFCDKNGVSFPMINYSDSGVIVNNKNTRLDVYTQIKNRGKIWANSFYKTIIRGGLNVTYIIGKYEGDDNIYDNSFHVPVVDLKVYNNIVDCDGNEVTYWVTMNETYNGYLKHIPTGCIDDFINMKMKRCWPGPERTDVKFDYEYFSKYNNPTNEKYQYYIEHTNLE